MAKTAIDWDAEGGRAWLERQGILSLISINETGTASSGDRQSVHSGLAAEGDR